MANTHEILQVLAEATESARQLTDRHGSGLVDLPGLLTSESSLTPYFEAAHHLHIEPHSLVHIIATRLGLSRRKV